MADIELLFKGLPLIGRPVELVFGEDDEAPIVDAIITMRARLPALRGRVHVALGFTVAMHARLPALRARIPVRYATDTARPLVGSVVQRWQASVQIQAGQTHTWQDAQKLDVATAAKWQNATPAHAENTATWSDADRTSRAMVAAHWQHAARANQSVTSRYQDTLRTVRPSVQTHWQDAAAVRHSTLVRFQEALRDRRTSTTTRWQDAIGVQLGISDTSHPAVPVYSKWATHWQNAMRPLPGTSTPPGPQLAEPCYLPPNGLSVQLLFADAWTTSTGLLFVCERHAGPVIPQPGATVVVPIRRIYMIFNSVSLRRIDGNVELPTVSMSMSLDVESWTWGFSASLPGRTRADLEPSGSGVPVVVEALVNGVPYRFIVEAISRSRSFGKDDLQIRGRGKTALLDAPYAPVLNFGNANARTAQQLMGDVLQVNGVPLDWSVNLTLDDWSVPAGVFSHQGSYIAALNAIANAAGGYVQPHASLQALDVLARYPVAPWQWSTITPDYELPSSVTTQEGIEWIEKPRYNRVFVTGQQAGVLGQVTRAGTAGDLVAPMVTDALITTAAAARQRGISVLSNTGRQAMVSLRLPVLAETGIIPPGKFVRYVDGSNVRLGLTRGVSVDSKFPNLWQTIGVETHV